MKVVVDRYAWLPKHEMTITQLQAVRDALLVVPRKVGDHPGEDPKPIPLWEETDTHMGVPREYFLQNRKAHHEIVYQYEQGAAWPYRLSFEGKLRPEQEEALATFVREFELPARTGGILRASPGWGKTVFACALIAKLKVPTLVVVHKEFLMSQWRERIQQFLPEARVGLVQQDVCDFEGRHVALAMVHSLAAKDYGEALYRWPGLVITDECFPAGTRVATPHGPMPIEDLREGDRVLCAVGEATVKRTLRREVSIESLCRLFLSDGTVIVCTANHPFLTPVGWKAAEDLAGLDVLTAAGCFGTMFGYGTKATSDATALRGVQETAFGSEGPALLLAQVYGSGQETRDASSSVRVVWSGEGQESSRPFLLRLLSAELVAEGTGPESPEDRSPSAAVARSEPVGGWRGFRTHASQEPHAATGSSEGCSEPVAVHGAQASCAWGQRAACSASASQAARCSGSRVEVGARGYDKSEGFAYALQDRHRATSAPAGSRGGWSDTQRAEGEGGGQAERCVPAFLRVDRVEGPERSGPERPSRRVEGDSGRVAVYNLTVDRHPSYILHDSKLLVHNCHRISAQTWASVPARFGARWRVGISATPRRKDGAEDVFFQQIGSVLFNAKEQRLKPKVKRVWSDFKLIKTGSFNPNLAPRTLIIKFLVKSRLRNDRIADQMVRAVAAGRKLLVLSERLQHLDDLGVAFEAKWRAEFPDQPVPALGSYVGGVTEDEREVSADAPVIMATKQYAEEGLDIPALDTLILATPMGDVEQAVGRILRPHEGKKEPIVVDIRDDLVPIFRKAGESRDKLYRRIA